MINNIGLTIGTKTRFDDRLTNISTIQFSAIKQIMLEVLFRDFLPLFSEMCWPFGSIEWKVIEQNLKKGNEGEIPIGFTFQVKLRMPFSVGQPDTKKDVFYIDGDLVKTYH